MRLRRKLAAFVFVASLMPLGLFGWLSVREAREAARDAAQRGVAANATQAATRIALYVRSHKDILKALAETVSPSARLTPDQQHRVLRNYVLEFRGFRGLTVFDRQIRPLASTRLARPEATPQARLLVERALQGSHAVGALRVEDDGPELDIAVPIRAMGEVPQALLGSADMLELWTMVDFIRPGRNGYALVLERGGRVLAGGTPLLKARVLEGSGIELAEPVRRAFETSEAQGTAAEGLAPRPDLVAQVGEYLSADGLPVIGAAAPIAGLDWAVVVEQPAAEAYAQAHSLQRRLATFGAGALILALLASVLVGGRFLSVIRALVDATYRVARGDFAARVEPKSKDELGDLARDFNQMAEKLDGLTRELMRKERMATFGRIAAGLAHDLKAPINSIHHQLRLLETSDDDPQIREKAKRRIEEQIAYLQRFIGELQGLMQERSPVKVELDVAELAHRVAESFAAQAQASEVALEVSAAPGVPRAVGSWFELSRVMENLVKNALEAVQGRAGARVQVLVRADGAPGSPGQVAQVAIEVRDNGPGIAPERLPLIFEEFRTTKGSGKGLGLGLASSSRLVAAMGGTIAAGHAPGGGASFTVWLPAAPAPVAPAGPSAAASVGT